MYPVHLTQSADGKTVGGYTTVIQVLASKDLRYAADERTGIVYDLKRDREALRGIPYGKLAVFNKHELAMQDGFALNPRDAVSLITGKLTYHRVNLPLRV